MKMVFIPDLKIGERKYKQIINFRACGQKIQEHKSERLNKIKRIKKNGIAWLNIHVQRRRKLSFSVWFFEILFLNWTCKGYVYNIQSDVVYYALHNIIRIWLKTVHTRN